jgi:cytochrome c-type biogenesis protein CcmE
LNARVKFAIGAGIIIVTLVWLGWLGATESKTYYHTISELTALKGSARHQRMRVSGYVKQGSIERLNGQVDFVLTEQGKTLPVSYVGTDPLPDTFYENNAQALVQGRLMPNGKFVADQVEAKCASKYVAAPTQTQASGPGGAKPPNAMAPAAMATH